MKAPSAILRMRALEPWAIEGFLALSCAWAAKCLWLPPSNFAVYPKFYALVERIADHEKFWAVIAGAAAMVSCAGLTLLVCRKCRHLGLLLRCIGLTFATFFWTVFGVSLFSANSDSIASIIYLIMAGSGYWVLIRGPALRARL